MCYGSSSPGHSQHIHNWFGKLSLKYIYGLGHSQHIQQWSGKLLLRLMYGLEQDHVMVVVVQDIHSTFMNGLGNVPGISACSGTRYYRSIYGPGQTTHGPELYGVSQT